MHVHMLTVAKTYQNQFQKYEPEPFVEQDVGTTVVSEEGPLLSAWVNRAAFQRSIGKIFYHAGFEDFQPSALEAMTDVAITHINHLTQTLKVYHEQPKKDAETPGHTVEEQILHTMYENGVDIESIESYIKDDVERQATKLTTMHERMKSHLADLLVSLSQYLMLAGNTDIALAARTGRSCRCRRRRCLQRR